MAFVDYTGVKSLPEAYKRAEGTGVAPWAVKQWWDKFGQSGAAQQNQYSNLMSDFTRREEEARKSNVAAEAEIRGTYGDIINQYQTGGAFKQAALADIAQTEQQMIGAGTQANISGGLFGTTVQSSLPVTAKAESQKSRLKLEDMLQQRTNQAKLGLASFVERIERPYPDYNTLLQAMIAQSAA